MCDSLPLKGETIVFTGSAEPQEAMELARSYGARPMYIPLIQTVINTGQPPDLSRYDWLIFTSAAAVEAFRRCHLQTAAKFAAVGEKTAAALQKVGWNVDFMPSVFSAEAFAKEFPAVAGRAACLFIKGAKAKDTITAMPLQVDEWTVYDTEALSENARQLSAMQDLTVVFASPSAVRAFTEAGGQWETIRPAAIGHVTKEAIEQAGGHVMAIPKKYTYTEVIETLAKGSCSND